eukprot:XP_017946060.1 PREDICTED: transmembrane protein 116 isoform X2 [Xenopus tropicalis]
MLFWQPARETKELPTEAAMGIPPVWPCFVLWASSADSQLCSLLSPSHFIFVTDSLYPGHNRLPRWAHNLVLLSVYSTDYLNCCSCTVGICVTAPAPQPPGTDMDLLATGPGLPHIVPTNDSSVDSMYGIYSDVKWTQFVTTLLSILGSGSVIGFAVFQNAVKSPEVRPLFYLSLSDLFLAICWLIGAVMYRKSSFNKNIACYNLQILGQMFYLSTFLYTLNYMWQLFCNVRTKVEGDTKKISDSKCHIRRALTVLSSLVPVLLSVPVLCFGNSYECYGNSTHPHSCLVLNVGSQITADQSTNNSTACTVIYYYSAVVFLSMFLLSAALILILMGSTYILCSRYLTTRGPFVFQQWAAISVAKQNLFLIPFIFFLCCMPAVTLTAVKLHKPYVEYEVFTILYFILALTAVSQGFFNCLAHGWTQRMLRYLKQTTCRDVDTQTPLLRSQKKCYASVHVSTDAILPQKVSAL